MWARIPPHLFGSTEVNWADSMRIDSLLGQQCRVSAVIGLSEIEAVGRESRQAGRRASAILLHLTAARLLRPRWHAHTPWNKASHQQKWHHCSQLSCFCQRSINRERARERKRGSLLMPKIFNSLDPVTWEMLPCFVEVNTSCWMGALVMGNDFSFLSSFFSLTFFLSFLFTCILSFHLFLHSSCVACDFSFVHLCEFGTSLL